MVFLSLFESGFVIVPVEPTEAMIAAAAGMETGDGGTVKPEIYWQTMTDAALSGNRKSG